MIDSMTDVPPEINKFFCSKSIFKKMIVFCIKNINPTQKKKKISDKYKIESELYAELLNPLILSTSKKAISLIVCTSHNLLITKITSNPNCNFLFVRVLTIPKAAKHITKKFKFKVLNVPTITNMKGK